MLRTFLLAAAAGSLAGCFDATHDAPQCTAGASYPIDLDEAFQYTPGVDAGYYVTYVGGGQWHVEWTCDTRLSAEGCGFSGSIVADAPASGPNASCFQCEADDSLSAVAAPPGTAGEAQMEIDFDTDTTTGVDGVDFTSLPGRSISLDLQVNGIDQPDVVNFVSGGADAGPACVPFVLVPPAP